MRWHKQLISLVLLGMIVSCGKGIGEEEVKDKIKAWWGAEEIENVIIDAQIKRGTSIIVDARLVVPGDTLKINTYEFVKTKEGWRIGYGPIEKKKLKYLLTKIGPKEIELLREQLQYIEIFKGILDAYASYTEGKYPAFLDVKINEISDYEGEKQEYSVLDLLKPFLSKEYLFIDAFGDTNEWFVEYGGKIAYFPLRIKGKASLEYTLKGSMDSCFTDDIFKKRE